MRKHGGRALLAGYPRNIRHTKSQNLNVSLLVLQLSLPNPLKPGTKSKLKMQLDRRCSNNLWVINNCIAHEGASYIRCLTVSDSRMNLVVADIRNAKDIFNTNLPWWYVKKTSLVSERSTISSLASSGWIPHDAAIRMTTAYSVLIRETLTKLTPHV